ncbi:hypothetical protein OH146_06375 [Salinibacterium sp. SYSU T00001]|uniref:hypothetical protein n=1 Tax=Homoserinimonas sedimenticola TaxID=2986805 RepID=UPI002235D9EA|nr:hypothetical protein [Salinibacterium sedimenticola]MCW4385397.1 hypothetical protein [Salinibacterium sedimenticola]
MPRRILALAAVLLLAPALAACTMIGDVVEQSVGDAVEGGLEGLTGVDVEGGSEIPANFPPSVPLVEGEVTAGSSLTVSDETTWTVSIATDAAVADVFAQARTLLSDAGFEQGFASETAEQSVASFGGEYTVIVTVGVEGQRTVANYVVTPVGTEAPATESSAG